MEGSALQNKGIPIADDSAQPVIPTPTPDAAVDDATAYKPETNLPALLTAIAGLGANIGSIVTGKGDVGGSSLADFGMSMQKGADKRGKDAFNKAWNKKRSDALDPRIAELQNEADREEVRLIRDPKEKRAVLDRMAAKRRAVKDAELQEMLMKYRLSKDKEKTANATLRRPENKLMAEIEEVMDSMTQKQLSDSWEFETKIMSDIPRAKANPEVVREMFDRMNTVPIEKETQYLGDGKYGKGWLADRLRADKELPRDIEELKKAAATGYTTPESRQAYLDAQKLKEEAQEDQRLVRDWWETKREGRHSTPIRKRKQKKQTRQRTQTKKSNQTAKNGPKVGEKRNGYEYIGGDPGKQSSWKKSK